VDTETIRVHAPSPVIFVCGGPYDVTSPVPLSFRDAFLRAAHREPFARHTILVAEELNAFFPSGGYRDILSFESDIAQIADLIILFSESYGSAAELGAFSVVEEIAAKLLVVIDEKNHNDNSFIRLGPLRALEITYGDNSCCVLNCDDINIKSIHTLSTIDISAFNNILIDAFEHRIAHARERTLFDRNRNGHIIKLLVGIIQHYGALTADELHVALFGLGVDMHTDKIKDLLLCAEFAKWVKKIKRGINTFYLPTQEKPAIHYKLKATIPHLNKERWRYDIREHWKKKDTSRFNCITSLIGSTRT